MTNYLPFAHLLTAAYSGKFFSNSAGSLTTVTWIKSGSIRSQRDLCRGTTSKAKGFASWCPSCALEVSEYVWNNSSRPKIWKLTTKQCGC